MLFNEYLETMLSKDQIKALKQAKVRENTVVIKGRPGRTGKSALRAILNKNGYKAIEEFEIFEITLDKILETPIADFQATIEGGN
jgi:hypothetical protein